MVRTRVLLFGLALLCLWRTGEAFGACGANTRTWNGSGSTAWGTAGNWTIADIPNTAAENAVLVSAVRFPTLDATYTVGCVDIQGGVLTTSAGRVLTVSGDYFRNLTLNQLNFRAADTTTFISMAGSAPQTFENVDPINNLRIATNSTVTLTKAFSIRNSLAWQAGFTGKVLVNADVTVESTASAITIPASATLEIGNSQTFTVNTNLTVSGTLKIGAGARVIMSNGATVTVNSGGLLQLAGAAGNIATLRSAGAGSTFTLNVAGQINADYFRIDRMTAAGLNVTGTIQKLDHGEFHYLPASGYAVTLGAAASIPTTMDTLGFFNDNSAASVKNFDAATYNLTAVTINQWSGGVGGSTFENDPNGKIGWGSQAGTLLSLSNNTAVGSPTSTLGRSSADTLFTTLAFSLNQASTATNITSVTLTQAGTATSADILRVRVYRDAPASYNCVYNAGTDLQIGSDLTLSGSPPTATFSIPSGDLATNSSTNLACIHVLAATSAIARNAVTIQFGIEGTSDVTNSLAYSFSGSSGPPVVGGTSTVSAGTTSVWDGGASNAWNTKNNWTPNTIPTSTQDCRVGNGTFLARLNVALASCLNGILQTGGTLDYNNTTNELGLYGSLDANTGMTFTAATAGPGVLKMRGANSQSLQMRTTFPGSFVVANTGAAGNNLVSVDENSAFSGAVTLTSGVLRISSGKTLTLTGAAVTVQSGAELQVEPGGTLALGNGTVLTVNLGGTLTLVGNASQTVKVTSTGGANTYSVVVNGNISANYYTFDHLGLNGLSIEAGATIDNTNHLQHGSFASPVTNNSTFLKLKRQIPGNAIDSLSFQSAGSAATGVKNIDTTGASAGTLAITSYSGDLSGIPFNVAPTYLISWTGATNTISINRDAAGPASVNAGQTYNMGRFGFTQSQAGASFVDASIISLKLTLTGTGSSTDISQVRIFYDSTCVGASGTLVGTGTFAGSPGTVTFSPSVGQIPVHASTTTPPKRCVYVEYDVATAAVGGNTVGVQIYATGDLVTDQGYLVSGATSPPITLGTAASIVGSTLTTWTGTTSTNWFTATNWSAGLPSATVDCQIDSASNNPLVNGASGTATCKNLTIGNGTLTLQNATSAILSVRGNFSNSGTFTQNDGTLRLEDAATGAAQQISSTSPITALTFNKTGGGTVTVAGTTLTVTTLTFPGTSNFTFRVPSGKVLILPNGVSVAAGTLEVQGGGTLKISTGQTLTVNGGTFTTSGVNDAYPQATANKALVTINGAGTWGFNATSGTVNLTGFLIDNLNLNGLVVGGTTVLSNLNGGQLRNLSASYSSMKALQLNTSSLPATASNFGWNWGPNNPVPADTQAYTLASSTGCGGNTITFNQWFGDFDMDVAPAPVAQSKVSATNCTITVSAANSPVTFHSLSAEGYNSAVALLWRTTVETSHEGFNVYRSTNPLYGYIQVNASLIRNLSSSSSASGRYRYVDSDVENDVTYYYLVEDVAVSGTKTRHGPVYAIPGSSAGAPPAPSGDTNTADSSTGAGTGNSPSDVGMGPNGGLKDLGNGAHILAQTKKAFRLEVVPPATTYPVSAWNAGYVSISVPGYSNLLEAGKPELPERIILVEVPADFSGAAVLDSTITEAASEGRLVQPAPSWAVDAGGVLRPSYSPSAPAYALDADYPAAFFEVDPALVQIQLKKYVRVRVNPVLFHGSTSQVRRTTRITIDVGLDGQGWTPQAPSVAAAQSPASVEGTVRVRFGATGFYEVAFDDLKRWGTEATLAGVATSDLRAYAFGSEIPIEIVDSDNVFNSGDAIRFWGVRTRSFEDPYSEIVLSRQRLAGSTGPAKRFGVLNGDPTGQTPSTLASTAGHAEFEENLREVFDVPMGSTVDHLYWVRIYHQQGRVPDSHAFHEFQLTLPALEPEESRPVRLRIALRGRGTLSVNPEHHLAVWVNGSAARLAEAAFTDADPTEVSLEVPSLYFVPGTNRVKLEAIASGMKTDEYEILDIDRIQVDYRATRLALNGVATLNNETRGAVITAGNFNENADVSVYDVSDPSRVVKVANVVSSAADGPTTQVQFLVNAGTEETSGYRLVAIQEGAYLIPDQVVVVEGYAGALKDAARRADLIVIGNQSLLEAASALISQRQSEGLRVVTATPAQIYAEFSQGMKSSQGIRDFLLYARASWAAPAPRFVLLLGDASYDASDRMEYGRAADLMPMPLERGTYDDFGSDHWFVADETTGLPTMAVGRLPTDKPGVIAGYVTKLLAYESGGRAPTAASLSFIVDRDTMGEGFAGKAAALSDGAKALRPDFVTDTVSRGDFASDALAKVSVLDQFGKAPLLMTYLGHGAEGLWATDQFFKNADATGLSNARLPFVVGLNCLNSVFYYPDPAETSLGESLVLNPTGGAIGFWGSTSLTSPTSQVALATAFQNELAQGTARPGTTVRVGEVMVRAKTAVGTGRAMTDTMRSWTFFGDPSVRLPASAFGAAAPVVAAADSAEDAAPTGGTVSAEGGGCGRARGASRPTRPIESVLVLLFFILSIVVSKRSALPSKR